MVNMKLFRLLLSITAACCVLDSMAQSPAPIAQLAAAFTAEPATERSRIAAERTSIEAISTNASAACYQNFFVNRCLDHVKATRLDALNGLRQQEIALNKAERKIKAAEQLSKIEEKSSPEKQRQDAEKRQAALRGSESRASSAAEKSKDRAAMQAQEKQHADVSRNRAESSLAKARERSEKQIAAAESVKKYVERQDKAEERQTRLKQELGKRTTASKPLPVPP